MTARRVHAVLAAGVNNPELIARWRNDPQSLATAGIDPESLDLAALWKFAGLTVKVRHNGVRQILPLTFRLLDQSGQEIELFAAYAVFMAERDLGYGSDSFQRARDLETFLGQWLDLRVKVHSVLWDLFRHELALARLDRPTPTPAQTGVRASIGSADPGVEWKGSTVLFKAGDSYLHEMQCEPAALGTILFRKSSAWNAVNLETHYFCYWRPGPDSGIQILELDAFGYHSLCQVDGVRTIGEISQELGGSRRPTSGFLRALGQLAAVGILQSGPARRPAQS